MIKNLKLNDKLKSILKKNPKLKNALVVGFLASVVAASGAAVHSNNKNDDNLASFDIESANWKNEDDMSMFFQEMNAVDEQTIAEPIINEHTEWYDNGIKVIPDDTKVFETGETKVVFDLECVEANAKIVEDNTIVFQEGSKVIPDANKIILAPTVEYGMNNNLETIDCINVEKIPEAEQTRVYYTDNDRIIAENYITDDGHIYEENYITNDEVQKTSPLENAAPFVAVGLISATTVAEIMKPNSKNNDNSTSNSKGRRIK